MPLIYYLSDCGNRFRKRTFPEYIVIVVVVVVIIIGCRQAVIKSEALFLWGKRFFSYFFFLLPANVGVVVGTLHWCCLGLFSLFFRSFIHSFIHSFVRSFVRSFIRLLVFPFLQKNRRRSPIVAWFFFFFFWLLIDATSNRMQAQSKNR